MVEFKLWLEFEEVEPLSWDIENDFANIHVDLPDGRQYGLNIWTYKFLENSIFENINKNKILNYGNQNISFTFFS